MAQKSNKLTAKRIDQLKEPGRYPDENGLCLLIDKAGRKYWMLRYTMDSKRRELSLGPLKNLSLEEARDRAAELRGERRQGIDRAARRTQTRLDGLSFRDAAEQVHAARTAGFRNVKHAAQWMSTLETYVFPAIGDKLLAEVSRGDVVQLLGPIWLKIPETARRVRQRIGAVIDYGVGLGLREHGIDMRIVTAALPKQGPKDGQFTAMPWEEVPSFLRKLALSSSAPHIRAGLEVLVLTASRPGNVRLMKWEQIDFGSATWSIPGDEMKNGKPHKVPLCPRALALLEAMTDLRPENSAFVFPGATLLGPLSLDAFRMTMRRMGSDCDPHGFRSSFKDWASDNGWDDNLSEKQLAHTDPDATRAAYARSDMLERRREMMGAWGAFVTGTAAANPKVVKLRRGQA